MSHDLSYKKRFLMEQSKRVFRSNRRFSRFVYGVCALMIAVCVATIANDAAAVLYLQRAAAGITVTESEGDFYDAASQYLVYAYFAVLLLCTIVFLVWVNRSNKNLDSFGYPKENSSKFAVGSYFIPLANIVLFYKVMSEIWHGSFLNRTPHLLRLWWAAMISSWLLSRILKSNAKDPDIPAIIASLNKDIFLTVLVLVSWTLTAVIVYIVSSGQDERNRELELIRVEE